MFLSAALARKTLWYIPTGYQRPLVLVRTLVLEHGRSFPSPSSRSLSECTPSRLIKILYEALSTFNLEAHTHFHLRDLTLPPAFIFEGLFSSSVGAALFDLLSHKYDDFFSFQRNFYRPFRRRYLLYRLYRSQWTRLYNFSLPHTSTSYCIFIPHQCSQRILSTDPRMCWTMGLPRIPLCLNW